MAAAIHGCMIVQAGHENVQRWREATESYGMELDEAREYLTRALSNPSPHFSVPADSRWLRNALARDLVACTCGAVGSAESWHPVHDAAEAQLCQTIASEAELALSSIYVNRGDESDHRWRPFLAPKDPGQHRARVDEDTLRWACGGALCPQLKVKQRTLEQYLQEYRERLAEHARSDYPNEVESYVVEQIRPYETFRDLLLGCGCTQLTAFSPLEMDRRIAPGALQLTCVYPHFMVGLTPGGSLVGVFGLTVWT